MYKFILSAMGASLLLSVSAAASCGNGTPCPGWTQVSNTGPSYQAPTNTPPPPVNQTQASLPGLLPGESLCPTTCPVSVHNPEGGKVLDCYKICKKVTPRPAPKPQYRYIRVIHPVIYVQPRCKHPCTPSRYGY